MFELLLLVAAAGGPAPSHLAAQLPLLPDFPAEARSGECWARVPVGPVQGPTPGGQAVWTLHRGTGPTAVWTLNQRPGPMLAAPSGPLDWARVDCGSGRVYAQVNASPPVPAPHPLPVPMIEPMPPAGPPPMAYAPPAFDAPPPPPMAHAAPVPDGRFSPNGPPSAYDHPRFAPQGPFPHAPGPHAPAPHGPGPYAQAEFGSPPMPFGFRGPSHAFAHPLPPRAPVAPWFGGRYLTWPGKTLR